MRSIGRTNEGHGQFPDWQFRLNRKPAPNSEQCIVEGAESRGQVEWPISDMIYKLL